MRVMRSIFRSFFRRGCATGSSVCFNLGRVFGAVILLVRGTLGAAIGMRWAVVAMSGLFWVGLLILLVRARDCAGRNCRNRIGCVTEEVRASSVRIVSAGRFKRRRDDAR